MMLDFSTVLATKGIRVTAFRLQVLEAFRKSSAAIEPAAIEQSLGDFDRITLYRTLKTFVERGVIHEINMDGEKKYALCAEGCGGDDHHHHDHIHFHCKKCGETFCLETEVPEIELPNYVIDDVEIQIKGVCQGCKS